ncbi:probable O-methyltransferase 3 [Cannabis sativa]|uniref:probable O-methyltransferase 3 n=1 Tax=Cannabis sativa TaxID=3483 RepID=UPI0029CA4E1D|nr:probable O-methyltransferase 3 [Cannabis sativa]
MASLLHGEGSSTNESNIDELSEAQSHLYKHMLCYTNCMALKCAIELGIPNIINNNKNGQPITLSQLVHALQIPSSKTSSLRRLMRVLVHFGFFTSKKEEEEEEDAYGLTTSTKLLVSNNNNNNNNDDVSSLSPYVVGVLEPAMVTPFHFLGSWFKKDDATTPFQLANNGMKFYEYWEKNTQFGDRMNEAMGSDSGMLKLVFNAMNKDLFKHVFEGIITSLVDVGGCTGDVCKILMESVLRGCSDEECVTILKKCKEGICYNKGGKVMIIDIVINSDEDENEVLEAKLSFDLLVMILFATGKERSQKDWETLIFQAGFTRYKITPLFSLKSLIELFP